MNYNTGVIAFRNTQAANYLIAVDYQLPDGSFLSNTGNFPGTPKVIKDQNNTPGITTELKNYYSLGNVKIVRDNGRNNFILQVRDLNNNIVTSPLQPGNLPTPQYPAVQGYVSNMNVDFDNGIVYFDPTNPTPFPADLYTAGIHRYNIYSEYRYRLKIINLRPGIVLQSEKVILDGKVLKRNEDYFIDYDAGIVTFYNDDLIKDTSVIDISYDYAPFGSSGTSTLVGLRSELSLTNNFFVGSTFIYNFASQTASVPDIRSTPSSLMVFEADSRLQDVKLPGVPLKMSVSGEYAQSQSNPNIMDKAIIESMDGISQTDTLSLIEYNWLPAKRPEVGPFSWWLNDISLTRQQVYSRDIAPKLENVTDQKQDILNINYSLLRQSKLSLVQVISKAGADYSQKLYIEAWINGDGNGEGLSFEYGQFDEDVDGSGVLKTEDKNNDGTLDAGEDVGWQFINPDKSITTYGAGNGRLDTEDWLGTGVISFNDLPASGMSFGPDPDTGTQVYDTNGQLHSSVDWTGWKLFKIPINIAYPEDWKNVRQFRLTITGTGGQSGTISIAKVSIVGNKWLPVNDVTVSSVTISAINTDYPGYVSLTGNYDYQQLYNSTNSSNDLKKKEQSLDIVYSIFTATTTVVGAKEIYSGTPYDLSQYQYLKFFVYPQNSSIGDTLFIRACGDDNDYFEYDIPITANWANGWRTIAINQAGSSGRAAYWVSIDPNGSTKVVGNPALNNISQIKVGVIANSAGTKNAEIWVDKIFVTDSYKKTGEAKKINLDLLWPGSKKFGQTTIGGGRKEIDRNFETFSPGVYDRDYLQDNTHLTFAGFNSGGVNWFPVSANLTKTKTVTPSIVQQQNNLVSTLDQGKVINYTGSGQTSLKLNNYLPVFGGTYSKSIIDTSQIAQLEDRETVGVNMDYKNPLNLFILPTGISTNYNVTYSYFKVYPSTAIADSDNFMDLDTLNKYMQIKDYHTLEITESWAVRAPFKFGKFWNLQPSYSINDVKQKDKNFPEELDYEKSRDQTVGVNNSFRFMPWLQPNLNYNIHTLENYNLSYSTTAATPTFPGDTKHIERQGNGELSWNFQVKDIIKSRYLQSLGFSSSYRLQDSDSYDGVPKTFDPFGASWDKLWIRGNDFNNAILQTGATNYIFQSYATKDDVRVAGRYNPFEAFDITGRLLPVKTMTANFTYTGTNEHSLITGTQKDVTTRIWPDLLFGFSQIERMLFLDRWVSDSQLNLKTQRKTVDTLSITHDDSSSYGADWRFHLLRRYDLSLSYNTTHTFEQDLTTDLQTMEGQTLDWNSSIGRMFGKWRCLLRYASNQAWQTGPTGAYTAQLVKNTYSGQVNSDMTFPGGIPIPFTKQKLSLTNRLIINGNITYSTQRSVLNIAQNNIDNYSVGSTVDYEISPNFRATVGCTYGRTVYTDNPQANYTTVEALARLNIQF